MITIIKLKLLIHKRRSIKYLFLQDDRIYVNFSDCGLFVEILWDHPCTLYIGKFPISAKSTLRP